MSAAGRYGALASARTLATIRDSRRLVPRRDWRAAGAGDSTQRWQSFTPAPGPCSPGGFLLRAFAASGTRDLSGIPFPSAPSGIREIDCLPTYPQMWL